MSPETCTVCQFRCGILDEIGVARLRRTAYLARLVLGEELHFDALAERRAAAVFRRRAHKRNNPVVGVGHNCGRIVDAAVVFAAQPRRARAEHTGAAKLELASARIAVVGVVRRS